MAKSNVIAKRGEKKDVRLLNVFNRRKTEAFKNLDQYKPIWIDNYRAYRAWRSRGDLPKADWQSDLRTPYIYQTLETIFPRMIDPSPTLDFLPVTSGDRENAANVRLLVNNQLYRNKFVLKQLPIIKPAGIFGLSWGKCTWKQDVRMRTRRNSLEAIANGAPVTARVNEVYYDDPDFSVRSVNNMAWDPAGTSMEEFAYILDRSVISHQHLSRLRKRKDPSTGEEVGVYENVDEVPRGSRTGSSYEEAMPNLTSDEAQAQEKGEIELIEMWVPSENKLVAVANGVIVRNEEYPYDHGRFPFVAITLQPDVYKFVGISEVEPLIGTQHYLQEVRNQMMDNARLSMDIVLLYKSGIENADDLEIHPGAKWEVNNFNDIQPLQMPQPQLAGISEVQELKGELQAISGATPYMSGADPTAMGVNQETATGVLAIQQESNKRMEARLMQVRAQAFEEIGLQFHELNEQFITEEREVRITESEFRTYTPEQITGRFDVVSRFANDALSKMTRQQNLMNLLQTLQAWAQYPLKDGKQLNIEPLLKQIAKDGDYAWQELTMDAPPPLPMQAPPGQDPAAAAAGGDPMMQMVQQMSQQNGQALQ